jgi:hypothetical protein
MTKDEFKLLIEGLFAYFQKFPSKNKAMASWFQRVNFIPIEAAKWIVKQIQDNKDSLPYNIGKAFLDGWRDYRKAHPHLFIIEYEVTPCNDCNGTGLIFFKELSKKLNRDERFMCKCGSCQNWKRHLGHKVRLPIRTLEQLKQKDYEIL